MTVSGGKATVDLAPIAQDTVAQEQVLLFGQIVLTLTEQRGIGQVEFLLPSVDGAPQTPILVPTATSAPKTLVSADDYRSLVAPESAEPAVLGQAMAGEAMPPRAARWWPARARRRRSGRSPGRAGSPAARHARAEAAEGVEQRPGPFAVDQADRLQGDGAACARDLEDEVGHRTPPVLRQVRHVTSAVRAVRHRQVTVV